MLKASRGMRPRFGSRPDQTALLRAIEEIASAGATLSLDLLDMTANVDAISDAAQTQVSACLQVRDSTAALVKVTGDVSVAADDARQAAHAANCAALESHQRIGPALAQIQDLASWSADSATRLDAVREALNDLRGVAVQIAAIARQSNMLALNAKVEAYRSGSDAFLVIAQNVQDLADQAAGSAASVGAGMEELVAAVDSMAESGRTAADKSEVVQQGAVQIRTDLESVVTAISSADERVGTIAKGISEAMRSLSEVDQGMTTVISQAEDSTRNLTQARDRIKGLRGVSEQLLRVRAKAGLDCTDTDMVRVTTEGAAKIQALFEKAVADRELTMEDLFDEHYEPVAGSSPQQYRTRFDRFTDRVAPEIQEAILAGSDAIDGCCLHDRNGYRPTMNLAFSQPQGSDPLWNTKFARTKGITKDESGVKASKNTQPYLLQAYRRTSGGQIQMLRDLSVPIFVSGRHWGALRTVYQDD